MENNNNNGLGLLSILTIIFVIAKLFGVITWSWLLVFAPALIGVGIGLLALVIALIITLCIK